MNTNNSQFAAANGIPSSPADEAKREQEIRKTFQPILAEHRAWANDPDAKLYPPNLVLRLVHLLLSVFAGEPFPQRLSGTWFRLLDLANKTVPVALSDLEAVDSSGRPKLAWVRAIEEFDASLKPKIVPNRVCPSFPRVMAEFGGDLRRDLYVAREFAIYSADEGKWIGPLMTASGDPNATAIFRELKTPGSVIPPGFHPEDLRDPAPAVELEPAPAGLLASLRRCLEINDVRNVEAVEDPATIEDLLCQGQYVPVIARIKNVSEDHVREIAAQLGIAAKTQSDDYKPADIMSEEDKVYQRNMLNPVDSSPAFRPAPPEADEPSPVSSSAPEFPSAPASYEDAETQLDDLLRGLYESNPDVDTPRAMQAVKNAKLSATGAVVGRKLAEFRRSMAAK